MDKPRKLLVLILLSSLKTSESIPGTSFQEDPFHHIVNLDPKGNFILEWKVNWTNRTVQFTALARTTGYVGFGLSSGKDTETGDFVIGGLNGSTGKGYLYDMHGPPGRRHPVLDKVQNYYLNSAWENGTHTRISFWREFESCDEEDYSIGDDTVRILWAYGEKDNASLYHYQNRGSYNTYLLDPDYTPREIQEARRESRLPGRGELGDLKIWSVTRRQEVPRRDTTYWCSFYKGPELSRRHHMVGFEYRWETDLEFNFTHHLVLFKCKAPPGEDPRGFFEPFVRNSTGGQCFFPRQNEGGVPSRNCLEVMYVYAIGARMFFLPNHTGIPFGDSPDEYYMLQTHYDNPNLRSGVIYDIKLDIYYTPNLREHDAGIAEWGHNVPASPSLLIPPNSLAHNIYGHCGGRCTKRMFPPEGIYIMGVMQHTHFSGIQHIFRQFRNGKELPWIFNDRNYDNKFQPTRHPRQEAHILPGDHLTVQCLYENAWTNGEAVVGGFSTRQEMCIVYVWYYNLIPEYPICRSQIVDPSFTRKHLLGVENLTWSDPDLEFTATGPPKLEGLTVGEIATNLVNWTEDKRKELQKDHKLWPQREYCQNADELAAGVEEREKIFTGFPKGVREYRQNEDKCFKTKSREGNGWNSF